MHRQQKPDANENPLVTSPSDQTAALPELPNELWKHTLTFLPNPFLKTFSSIRSVSKFWHCSAQEELRRRLQLIDNNYYQEVNHPDYQAVFNKHKIPFNWQANFINIFQKVTKLFTDPQQLSDYLLINSCCIENIQYLLSCNDGQRRIFLTDAENRDIFYFLKTLAQEKRQTILDCIFASLTAKCKNSNGEWIFNTTHKPDVHATSQPYGKPLASLINFANNYPNESTSPPLTIVFAALCNQVELLKLWYKHIPNLVQIKHFVCTMAIILNYEEMFNVTKDDIQELPFLVDCGLKFTLEYYKSISLSQTFSAQLFHLLKQGFTENGDLWLHTPLNQLPNLLFHSSEANTTIEYSAPIYAWSIILKQNLFNSSEFKIVNPDILLLNSDNRPNHRRLLEFSYKHSYEILLELLAAGAIPPFDIIDQENENLDHHLTYNQYINPFYELVEANDLIRIDEICSQHKSNTNLIQHFLAYAAATGNINCFTLMIRYGAKIDRNIVKIAICCKQISILDAILLHDENNKYLFSRNISYDFPDFPILFWIIKNKLHELIDTERNQSLGEYILYSMMSASFNGAYSKSEISKLNSSMKLLTSNGVSVNVLKSFDSKYVEMIENALNPTLCLTP